MIDEQFFRKKQLLAQRDQILEEIGQAVFDGEALPEEFTSLRGEFRGMEIVIRKLQERFRLYKEERERVSSDLREINEQMAERGKHFKKIIQPLRLHVDELTLKLEYHRSKKKTTSQENQELEIRLAQARAELTTEEKQLSSERRELETLAAPLEKRVHRLDTGILEVQNEKEHFRSNRRKRLRDLGYWCDKRKQDLNHFEAKYSLLKMLRMELSEFKHARNGRNRIQRNDDSQDPPEKESSKWLLPLLLLLVAMILGFVFRTEFREDDLSLSGISDGFIPNESDYRIYANLVLLDANALNIRLPKLETLPGGNTTFRDMDPEDLLDFLEARVGGIEGELLYFGARFRKAPPRFALRLAGLGWDYLPSIRDRKAISDGTWIWLVLNEYSFFLFPKSKLEAFQALLILDKPTLFFLKQQIEPFSNNQPLLAGYHGLAFKMDDKSFELDFKTQTQQFDALQRQDLLAKLPLRAGEINTTIDQYGLHLKGPTTYLASEPLKEQQFKEIAIDHLAKRYQAYQASNTEQKEPSPSRTGNLHVFSGLGEKQLANFPLDEQVRSISYQNRREQNSGDRLLLITERGIISYSYSATGLNLRANAPVGLTQGFKPGRIVLTPDETRAVVLEHRDTNAPTKQSSILLLAMDRLQTLARESLPIEAGRCESAAWDSTGKTLYLGCQARMKGDRSSHAILVYNRDRDTLHLTKLIELPMDAASYSLPDINPHPNKQELYLSMWPQERLVRHELNGAGDSATQMLNLVQSMTKGRHKVPGTGLLLNRNAELAVAVGSLKKTLPASKALYLVDIQDTQLSMLDTLDPNTTITGIWRQPLSDRFWVLCGPQEKVFTLKIEQERLHTEQRIALQGNDPRYICGDRLGRYVFIYSEVTIQ